MYLFIYLFLLFIPSIFELVCTIFTASVPPYSPQNRFLHNSSIARLFFINHLLFFIYFFYYLIKCIFEYDYNYRKKIQSRCCYQFVDFFKVLCIVYGLEEEARVMCG